MRTFNITDYKSLFDMKQEVLNKLYQMELEVHNMFAPVQNEGTPFTQDTLQSLSETLGRFGEAYNDIDDLLEDYARKLLSHEVTNEE